MELTDKEVEYYDKHVALQLENILDDCRVRRWDILFDEDYLSEDTQKPAFILHDEEILLGYVDMNGDIELNNSSFGNEDYIERFSPKELMVLSKFAQRLNNNNYK